MALSFCVVKGSLLFGSAVTFEAKSSFSILLPKKKKDPIRNKKNKDPTSSCKTFATALGDATFKKVGVSRGCFFVSLMIPGNNEGAHAD